LTPNLAEKVRGEILTSLQGEAKFSFDFQKSPKMENSSMTNQWALILLALAESDQRIIVMDGDLQLDTGTYLAASAIGSRYVQMGIAEQDMVSTAGTLALSGFIPIVHSFSTFLTMRPHEQIFNNATEKTKIIYVGFLSGIVPSYAGFSHQAVSDMTTMSAIPGMMIFEPATLEEVKESLRVAMSHAGPSYMRMNSLSPIIAPLEISSLSSFGSRYGFGEDFSIVCSGSFSLGVAIEVIKKLELKNIFGSVFTLPVKSTSGENLGHELDKYGERVLLVENGNVFFGSMLELYFALVRNGKSAKLHSIEGLPVSGEILEVSRFHQMDADSISKLVEELLEVAS
jgi:transketolase